MRALRLVVLSVLFAAGLWYVAWWTIPVIAAVYALVTRHRAAAWEAMASALIASVILLARQLVGPASIALLSTLGQVFPIPGVAVAGLTLLLAMVLAYTSARVVLGIAGRSTAG